TAKDDLGNVIESQGVGFGSSSGAQYPGEWQGGIALIGAHPRAKKLVWVEGDLIGYKVFPPHRVGFPAPLAGRAGPQEGGGALVELTRFEPGPDGAAAGALGPAAPNATGPVVEMQVTLPGTPFPVAGQDPGIAALLVGASGRVYRSFSGGQGMRS